MCFLGAKMVVKQSCCELKCELIWEGNVINLIGFDITINKESNSLLFYYYMQVGVGGILSPI